MRKKNCALLSSRKELHRIKSSRPRRRVAIEAVRRRAATRMIYIPEKDIMERFRKEYGNFSEEYFTKADHRIRGIGKGRIVLSLNSFTDPVTRRRMPLVLKVYRIPDLLVEIHKRAITKSASSPVTDLAEYGKNPEFFEEKIFLHKKGRREKYFKGEEHAMKKMAVLGIPTVRFAKAVKLDGMEGIVVEDLSNGSRFRVKEFEGFDFNEIENASSLKKAFEEHCRALMKAGIKKSEYGSHGKSNLRQEIEKCFFVVINPKTKTGRLVVGDADHIEF